MTRQSAIVGIDPAQPFLEYARIQLVNPRITFDQCERLGPALSGSISKHATGGQPRTDDLLRHLHAAVVAQGTNMGPVEMAHSANLTYDRLALASFWYLREETLKAAVTALVNFQYRQPLAQHWGGGTLSSSDGQRFPVRGKVRNASALPALLWLRARHDILHLEQ